MNAEQESELCFRMKNNKYELTCNLQNSGRHVCDPEPKERRKSFSESMFYLLHRQAVSGIHMWLTMASGGVSDVLDDCIKKINANTAQLENFLRQVFCRLFAFCVKKIVATSLADI